MKKKVLQLKRLGLILCLTAMGMTGKSYGQLAANTYLFSATSGTFTEITGTGVSSIQADDATSAALPIGFTFNYCGTDYTQVKACSNGWVTFNTAVTTTSLTNSTTYTADIKPALMALWDDLSGSSGTASYQTTGTAPNRIFTMQYKNWLWNYGASSPSISFQVKLYETSNIIQFVYRQESGAGNAAASSGASIGIIDNTAPTPGYLSLNNASTAPVASSTAFTDNLTTRPATGQVYQFKPLPALDMMIDTVYANAPFCSNSSQVVYARLDNQGTATVNTVDIYWQVDGVAQPTVTYNTAPIGNLVSGNNKTDVALGQVFFPDTNPRSVKAWVYMPNGMADEVNTNDTTTDPVAADLPGVVLNITPRDTTICQGHDITLDAGTFPNDPIYVWSTGSLTQTIVTSTPGMYTLMVQNSYGCFDRDTVNISVYPNPVVNSIAIIDNGSGSFTFNVIGAMNVTHYVWDFGDMSATVPGSGIPGQQLHTFAPGTYTVTLTLSNDCGQIVVTRIVEVEGGTGIDQVSALQQELKIYPNPAKAVVTVSSHSGELKIKGVQLYNLMGQKVFEATGDRAAGKQSFDISGLASGIYNVMIDTDKGKAVKKLEVIK